MIKRIYTVDEVISKLTLEEKVGQFFMAPAFINDTEDEIEKLEELIAKHNIGGLCFFHSRESAATNFENNKASAPKEKNRYEDSFYTLKTLITRYQKAAKYPLLISIDAEWGLAMRIENTPQYPYAITLGACRDRLELTYEVGKQIAKDCKIAGVHWNLSPVVDINTNPKNPVIGYRSFGDDKNNVLALASAYIKGSQSEGVITSIKHFPGHGDTEIDSHLGLPVINKSKKELLGNELYPFQKLINEGVDSVMVGHLSVPSLTADKNIPSSINKDIITGLLRHEMGFDGVIISDALNMHAVSKRYPTPGKLEWLAFDAGNDILCFAEHVEKGIQAILKNATESQINASLKRIWKLKQYAFKNQSNDFGTNSESKPLLNNPSVLNRKIAEESLTFYHGDASDIKSFRDTDSLTLNFKREKNNLSNLEVLASLKKLKNIARNSKKILLLLTPPQMKPNNNFGFLKEEINFINDLIASKEIIIYNFGNPYALTNFNIKQTNATIIVYQDFKEFRNVAKDHFLGKIEVKGKLPVMLE